METTQGENLASLSKEVFENTMPGTPMPSFTSFEELLDYIYPLAKEERQVLLIDEYPYLAQSYRPISSIIQNQIDLRFRETKLFLILCSSSLSFMENQVLGYKSPLYGRRTAQFKIRPFTYKDIGFTFLKNQTICLSRNCGIRPLIMLSSPPSQAAQAS